MSDAAITPQASVQIAINNQYIKDFSFESPNAPQIFTQLSAMPSLNVGVNVQTRALAENVYEVMLSLKLDAVAEGKKAFLAELAYGGVFTVPAVTEESLKFILLVEAPRLLFPFARNIIANAVRDGGFPPLLINPIDFTALYQERSTQLAQNPAGTA